MQIMKGYHCSSDSVNLRVPDGVRVCVSVCLPCLCLDVCMFWAAYGYTSQGAQRSRFSAIYSCLTGETIRSADSTRPPDVLTVTSCNFLKRSLKGSGSRSAEVTFPQPNLHRGIQEERRLKSRCFSAPDFFCLLLFPFEVVRDSFKPHHTSTLNTRKSVMNMHQQSIWHWD